MLLPQGLVQGLAIASVSYSLNSSKVFFYYIGDVSGTIIGDIRGGY